MALKFLNDGYFAGKVGIGTESPIELLHLYGGVGNPTRIRLQADDGQDDVLTFHQSTTQKGAVGYDDSDDVVSLTYGGLSGTTGIKINSSGNVGIGNTNPQYPLHFGDVSGYYISIGSGNSTPGGNTPWLGVFNNNSITSATYGWGIYDSSADGSFQIWNRAGNTTGYNTFTIKRGGNVGIGTTSPGLKLDINSGTANSALRVLSTDRYTGIKFEDVSNNDTLFYDGQSDLMYLGSTNFRAVDLHAAGNLRVEGAIYDSNNSPGTANQVLVSTVTGTDWVDGSAIPGVPAGSGTLNTVPLWTPDGDTLGDSPITISGNDIISSGRGVIENTTNLTTGIVDSLLIKTLSSGTTITNGFGAGLSFYLENTVYSAVNEVAKIAVIETDTIAIDDKMVFSVKDNNILAERLTLTGQEAVFTGNVGIGTTNPGAKLEISHSGSNNGLLLENTLNSSNYQIALNIRENEGLIFQRWTGGIFNGNLMRIGYTGAIKFDAYDSTNNTGTPTYLLGTDGSGNVVKTNTVPGSDPGPYLPLAGGTMIGDLKLNDAVQLKLGTSNDLRIYHSGTNSNIENNSGTLQIIQNLDDGDIVFKSDNGSGNTTPYFQLDGSHTQSIAWKDIHFVDGIKAKFGDYASPDLQIYHDSSDNNSYIKELGTGSLQIWAKDFEVYNADGTETLINADVNAGVQLYFDNSTKIATTSAGIAVTGGGTFTTSVTASGNSNSFGNTSIAALTATSGAFSASVTAAGNSNSFGVTTFTGNITANGYLTLTGQATPQLFMQSNTSGTPNWTLIASTNGTFTIGRSGVANDLYFNTSGSATFTSKAYGVAPITSDPNSTIATKGYVQSVITGATIYRGTWNPDVSLNSGYGNPNLNTVTQTSGYYYICSADGAATPNGTGNEPDSWNTGDWVIWNDDVGASGEWQKIDNSSVLSGVGTGQTVALWQGPNTVTDSETLGNAPITVNGNNSTFAGDITSAGLTVDYTGNRTGDAGILVTNDASDWGIKVDKDGTADYGILSQTDGENAIVVRNASGVNKIQLQGDGDASFAGDVDVNGGQLKIQGDFAKLLFEDTAGTDLDSYIVNNANGLFFGKTNSPSSANDILSLNLSTKAATFAGNVTVNSDSNAIGLRVNGRSSDDIAEINMYENDGTTLLGRIQTRTTEMFVGSITGMPLKLMTAGSVRMTVLSGGNVGIGTTSPGAKLEVSGSLFFRDFVRGYVGTGTTQYVGATWLNASDGVFYVRSADVDKVVLNSNGDSYFNGGNVGIGTTSPNSKLQIVGKATSSSTVSTDAATTLVTKDYVDSSAGNPSYFRQGHKSHTLTNAFTTCLTVNLNSHTGCYVTVCCFGDWGSHSSAAYRGEFFLQNGANGYSEPGIILRQDDNTSNGTDQIVCQILDPTGSGNPKDFEIQIRTTATTGTTSFTGLLTFTVQGQFNSVT